EAFWDDAQPPLSTTAGDAVSREAARVPRRFFEIAATVACHRDEQRWSLLYSVLYRLRHGIPHLLEIPCDGEVNRLYAMERDVGRDSHRMQSFARFRKVDRDGQAHYIAWYRPDHYVVERTAPWFVERFNAMRWSILTPDRCAYWDLRELRFASGVPRTSAPEDDELEALWRAYYAATFDPARLDTDLLRQHVPVRYRATLPETRTISELVGSSAARESDMRAAQPRPAHDYIPAGATLEVLRRAIHNCRACDLYCSATQPVFGEGPEHAVAMFVGEQPGENEDRTGRPFVGPAGQLLDHALAQAGVDRGEIYLTGAVKHFKFEERGRRRIHKTASRAEVAACRPWLDAQIEVVRPRVLVALGATAALSLTGRQCAITRERGCWMPHPSGAELLLTLHPSFVLRVPDPERQAAAYGHLVDDLRLVRAKLAELRRGPAAESHRRAQYAVRSGG
ncbi:MAG TPA: UdgX family uracil-DNA binding protein, partial [Bryobacteraceae bacterium]|nr:UdgX family uracil-DNA binding protein [Bryobacteraceae bacterium]